MVARYEDTDAAAGRVFFHPAIEQIAYVEIIVLVDEEPAGNDLLCLAAAGAGPGDGNRPVGIEGLAGGGCFYGLTVFVPDDGL